MNDEFVMGENGLIIPFAEMFSSGDYTSLSGQLVLVNMRTVVRNAINAFDSKNHSDNTLVRLLPQVLDETLVMLRHAFMDAYQMPVKYYLCEHKDVKYGNLAKPVNETPVRKLMGERMTSGINHIKSQADIILPNTLERPTDDIPKEFCIITHYAEDLKHYKQFRKVVLLESHTGDIRGPDKFNRKLNLNGEQYKLIPFNAFTQRIFGDGTLYGPMSIDVRRNITDIAKKTAWTRTTPFNRVSFLVNQHNPALARLFRNVLL